MSNGLKLSIMGLYNHDDTVLDLMQFPDAFTAAQIENVKNNILIECADFEFLYPAPAVAKSIIGIWSAKEKPYWNRIYNASLLEYNPIENYRRNETETITDGRTEEHSGSDTNRASGSDTNTASGSDTVKASGIDKNTLGGSDSNQASGTDSNQGSSSSTNTESGSDTITNKITGFDSDTLVNHDSSATAYGHVVDNDASGSNTQTYGRKDTTTYGKTDQTEYGRQDQTTYGKTDQTTYGKTDTFTHGEKIEHEGSSERSVLAYGNIGVTTSQQMLTEEIEVAKIIQVANIIIESFKKRFCLMVY